jgi:uncharacterized membrane protein YfcA
MGTFQPDSLMFLLLLPAVAYLYASVGHGGASGYLALMALFSFTPAQMRPTALMLNMLVSVMSFVQFARNDHFNLRLFFPFAIGSVPMAFIGGMIEVDERRYKIILGVVLLVAVLRLLGLGRKEATVKRPFNMMAAIGAGAGIGLFSGLIGIGGGIILSPLIILLGWADLKTTAGVSALFILVNSMAGYIGGESVGLILDQQLVLMALLAFVGGTLGAYMGSFRLAERPITYLLATVLAIAGVKLMML